MKTPARLVVAAALVGLLHAHPAAAAEPHAPSVFHRVYPPATQAARDWAWKRLGGKQFDCLDRLWHFESGWRVRAGRVTGSYGIPQAYPGTKMRSAGADWQTNPMTQVRWGLGYVRKYGGPCGAWAFWQQHRWY